ncbi:MAG: family 10 glycosylhydrolase [Cyanobacteria bacterium J06623_4]
MRSLISSFRQAALRWLQFIKTHLKTHLKTHWLHLGSKGYPHLLKGFSLRHGFSIGLLAIALIGFSLLAPRPTLQPTSTPSASLNTASPAAHKVPKPPSEIRGVWITNVASNVLFAPWGIPRAIDQLADMHFNTVYPVVWNRGKTFYHSPTLKKLTGQPIEPLIALTHPSEDPLREMARLGHRKHLRVIPWFEYGFMVPLNSKLAKQHPDWLTTRQNGSLRLQEETFNEGSAQKAPPRGLAKLLNSGAPTELGWLNPLHPSVQALIHPSEDPLREMARLGHRKHLRVIPWFEYGFMVPLNSKLAKQHPDWLTTRQNGSLRLQEETFNEGSAQKAPPRGLAKLLNSGAPTELGWLNPLHPSVQALILDLAQEVVSQYDVDGIQFDDHFSLPVDFGYDPYTVSLYRAEHQGQAPPTNPADEGWIRWRAGKLSSFVKELHSTVKAACPTCLLSLSPNPAKFAYRFHLQDWRTWVENDWLDELVVQVYRDDLYRFEGELAKNTLQATMDRIPVSIGILTGTWRRPISFEQIQAQVVSSRNHHFSGVSFFYWETLWSYFTPESPQQRRRNFRALLEAVS